MTDLQGRYYATVLPQTVKKHLFLTYEEANWIIFLDAFPQLLLYEESKRRQIPLFHLLQYFNVSIFMEKEWIYFWEKKDINRLMTALIINEQNKIQKPVIENAYFKKTCIPYSPFLNYKKCSILVPLYSQPLKGRCMVFQFINLKRYRSV